METIPTTPSELDANAELSVTSDPKTSVPFTPVVTVKSAEAGESNDGISDNSSDSEIDQDHEAILDPSEDTGESVTDEDAEFDEEGTFVSTPEWYSIAQEIAKPDTGGIAVPGSANPDQVVNLMDLDAAGRQVLTQHSYESVVDVNVEDGGVLEEDEDNNEFFTGVGLDALVESEVLLENLRKDFGIVTASHVQLAAIPRLLDQRDVVMQSYTGTGKTLAFLLPILDELDESEDVTQAVVVAPTRELAMQISRECDRLIVNTKIRNMPLIGGANPARQVEKLRRSLPHIVVGTPGRLAELAETRELRLRSVNTLVVDEVDQCLVGEFGEQVHRLLRAVPRKTQKVLVSATGDVDSVRRFAGESLHRPVLLRVGGILRIPRHIQHWMCVVPARMKIEIVRKLIYTNPVPERTIVFVDDPRRVEMVSERLWQMRVPVGALRGNAHKMERKEVLDAFRKGKVEVLVSTEVAARGLDVPELTHVINLDLPTDGDHYVHRAGRCGRVRKSGHVVSIVSGENAFVMRRLSKEIGIVIARMEPRNGEYGEPLERSTERRPKKAAEGRKVPVAERDAMSRTADRKGSVGGRKTMPKIGGRKGPIGLRDAQPKLAESSNVLYRGNKSRESSAGTSRNFSMKKVSAEIEELKTAMELGDVGTVKEKLFLEEEREEMSKTVQSQMPEEKKSKLKIAMKKEALKQKKKIKEKKRTRSSAKPKPKPKEDELDIEVDSIVRTGPSSERRLRRNVRNRAVLEGWVGNRPNEKEEK